MESRCEQLEQECISLRGDTQAVAEENPESTTVFSTQEGLPITDELRSQLREKEQELRLAQETLAQDENIVQQWSGTLEWRIAKACYPPVFHLVSSC